MHEVLDYHSDESFPNAREVLDAFKFGIEAYRAAKWNDAIASFERALTLNPGDGLSQMYIDRCVSLRADPPADWDGVWVAKEK